MNNGLKTILMLFWGSKTSQVLTVMCLLQLLLYSYQIDQDERTTYMYIKSITQQHFKFFF